jgi:hypothetical protein
LGAVASTIELSCREREAAFIGKRLRIAYVLKIVKRMWRLASCARRGKKANRLAAASPLETGLSRLESRNAGRPGHWAAKPPSKLSKAAFHDESTDRGRDET